VYTPAAAAFAGEDGRGRTGRSARHDNNSDYRCIREITGKRQARYIIDTHTHTHKHTDTYTHAHDAPSRILPVRRCTYTSIRKHGYLSGGGLYACCRCKLAPGYRQRNRTRSHCMNIICIQVGYIARAGISWLARINDYMDPTDVGGPATPRAQFAIGVVPFYALLLPSTLPALPRLALSRNALLMARAYNLWLHPRASPRTARIAHRTRARPEILCFFFFFCRRNARILAARNSVRIHRSSSKDSRLLRRKRLVPSRVAESWRSSVHARCTHDDRGSGAPTHGASLSRARPCRAIAFVLFPHRRHPPPSSRPSCDRWSLPPPRAASGTSFFLLVAARHPTGSEPDT